MLTGYPIRALIPALLAGSALALVSPVLGQGPVAEAPVAVPAPTAEEIWEDVRTFEMLHTMRLTSEQARDWAERVQALQGDLDKLRGHENSPAVIAVLLKIRQAALQGLPVSAELWEQLSAAQEAVGGGDQGEDAERKSRELADALALSLSDLQLADLVRSEALFRTRDIISEARDVLAAPKDTWTAWMERTVADIVLDTPDLPAGAEDQLEAFFVKLRATSGDELDQKQDQLVTELLDIIAPLGSPDELRAQARERLQDHVLYSPNFAGCLREYAAVAAGG